MNKKITHTLIFFLLLSFRINKANAIYNPTELENNKVGIHILDASEIQKASELINSNGGKWGYVTVPIQPTDRDRVKWQSFMQQATELKIIPILRITTIPNGGTWSEALDTDLVDFANFLDELYWPTENRYIILFNEVNRAQEWGGDVNPEKYAQILKNANLIFKERSDNFFILPAGLDSALPNSDSSMSAFNYLTRMKKHNSEIWNYIDGWTSHSYPNPAFAASPYKTGWQSITSYKSELYTIGKKLPIFITETGWDSTKISGSALYSYYQIAWQKWLSDPSVIAVTPFILTAEHGDFTRFSFTSNGNTNPNWQATEAIAKKEGNPRTVNYPEPTPRPKFTLINYPNQPSFNPFSSLIKLENILRSIFNLPKKSIIKINNQQLTVEIATKPSHISKGLSGRTQLSSSKGMLFIFDTPHIPTFWMKNMNFALDLIWIRSGKIIDFTKNAKPEGFNPKVIYSPLEETDMVLEVNSGYIERSNISLGDKIEFVYK